MARSTRMNADLEAAIAEGRRRMKQFEEKTSHQLDMFERSVDEQQHLRGHKYSNIQEDLKPVSWPLWGVVLETSSGQQVYKEHVPFELVAKSPLGRCGCTSSLSATRPLEPASSIPSIEAKAIMEGRRWGVDKYLYDEQFVSNPPLGVVMRKSHFDQHLRQLYPSSSRPDPDVDESRRRLALNRHYRRRLDD